MCEDGDWVLLLTDEHKALLERVRELDEAEQRAEQYNLELIAENTRLREALVCCADMLCRVDAGTATESAIDFARNVASNALEASDV